MPLRHDRESVLSSHADHDAIKLKVSVLGDIAVGKTCLAHRFVQNIFQDDHKPTISDIETKRLKIKDSHVILQIWDTAGQERFRSLLPLYMKGIDGALVVYDVTNKESFEHVPTWISEVRQHAAENTVIMLAGNKLDKCETDDTAREVRTEDAETYADISNISFLEVSAKSGHNVNHTFLELGEEMLARRSMHDASSLVSSIIKPTEEDHRKRKKCC